MMINRQLYLQHLGITSWRLRTAVHQETMPDGYRALLNDKFGQTIGMIAADIESGQISELDQNNLLQKIAAVLSADFKIEKIFFDKMDFSLPDLHYLILLGDHAVAAWHAQKNETQFACIQSVSLATLFNNAHEKKILWQQLKPLCS